MADQCVAIKRRILCSVEQTPISKSYCWCCSDPIVTCPHHRRGTINNKTSTTHDQWVVDHPKHRALANRRCSNARLLMDADYCAEWKLFDIQITLVYVSWSNIQFFRRVIKPPKTYWFKNELKSNASY